MKTESQSVKKPVSAQPSAVYRLQFSKDFTFNDAARLIPYLNDLGIDFLYCSPYFQSAAGGHGYSVTDSNKINPEIGTEEEFEAFCAVLNRYQMGQILDIVPNHMGISGCQNSWWLDVLENGPASLYAEYFDIDWEPVKKEITNKILVPVLGNYYGDTLESGEIQLGFKQGHFTVRYFENWFPLAPETYESVLGDPFEILRGKFGISNHPDHEEYLSILTALQNLPGKTEKSPELKIVRNREKENIKKRLAALTERSRIIMEFIEQRTSFLNGKKGDPASFNSLHLLLDAQTYRLAFWRVASEEINYRRFFDINELAAIHVENPKVFDAYHSRALSLLRENKIQGVRIDHADGLYDPPEYFKRLQDLYRSQSPDEACREPQSEAPLFVIVEKILDRKETLPEDWQIQGTVGYDFLNLLNGLFIERESEEQLNQIYEHFIECSIDFDQLLYEKKKFLSFVSMASEMNALGHRLDSISEKNPRYRDFTQNNLTAAIREFVACFPVYRTYISSRTLCVSEKDKKYITAAIEKAKKKTPYLDPAVYEFLKKILLLQWDITLDDKDRDLYLNFVMRLQQLTGPIMAKGLEDTCFYIYNRLISLNEVGADPSHYGISAAEFHAQNQERKKKWPYSFLTTSTHDSKRSEDARYRINAISEWVPEWKNKLEKWAFANRKHKTMVKETPQPDANVEYLIYQTLLGVWPDENISIETRPAFLERVWNCLLKSVREAKVRTDWLNPDEEYEENVEKFIRAILEPGEQNLFLTDFLAFQAKIACLGFWNSVSALTLKIGAPGTPETYQGCELWNYCMVDPDNRRPVDYQLRAGFLDEMKHALAAGKSEGDLLKELIQDIKSGRLKLYILWKGLNYRKNNRQLFLEGEYRPLQVEGSRSENIIAYARENGGQAAVVFAARFFSKIGLEEAHYRIRADLWEDTMILLPPQWTRTLEFKNIFTGETVTSILSEKNNALNARDLFKVFSAGLLAPIACKEK